jgi:hypothetical protein
MFLTTERADRGKVQRKVCFINFNFSSPAYKVYMIPSTEKMWR